MCMQVVMMQVIHHVSGKNRVRRGIKDILKINTACARVKVIAILVALKVLKWRDVCRCEGIVVVHH